MHHSGKRIHQVALTMLVTVISFTSFIRADTLEYSRLPGQFVFGPTASQWFAVGDVNGDGWDEVIRCGYPPGNFTPHVLVTIGQFHLSANSFPVAHFCIPRLADMNNDGQLDIVTAPQGDPHSLGVLLGNGYGTFQSQILTPIGYAAADMITLDVNKDGNMDVILVGYPASPVDTTAVVVLGNGDGTFGSPASYQTSPRSPTPFGRAIAAGDVNGDTWPDLVVVNRIAFGEVTILMNNGDGTFAAPNLANSYQAAGSIQMHALFADMNGDGDLDLVTSLGDDPGVASSFPGHHVAIRLGNGDGTFGSYAAYNVAPNTDYYGLAGSRIAIEDMDADGKLDVLVTAAGRTGLISPITTVLLGNGDGTLGLGPRMNTPGFISPMPIRLNGDVYRDIVVAPNSSEMALLQAYIQPSPVTFSASNIDKSINDPSFDLASASAAQPAGGTFSGPGVSGGSFSPSVVGLGVHTITYTSPPSPTGQVSNGSFTVTVRELPGLVVNTASESTPVDGQTSLREALAHATSLGGAQTITFAAPLAGQAITLSAGWNDATDASALRVAGNINVQGPATAPGITLAVQADIQKRHFLVEASGSLTLENLTLTGGTGDYGGAVWNFGALTVRGCTFTGNQATMEGGAIQAWGDSTSLLVENSTFIGNSSSGICSAINAGSASMMFRHVTITGNTATNTSGALGLWKNQATLVNSIVAGNSDDSLGLANGGSFSAASTNNLLGSGGSGGFVNGVNGNLVGITDPLLGVLAQNGGPTATVALLPGSPAINAAATLAGITTDQRGTPRPQFGAADIGAFEQTPSDNSQTIVTTGGASWYLGPDAVGADLRIYREVAGEIPIEVGGLAVRIGLANDGTVLVQNSFGQMFARIGSTTGIGTDWQFLPSVTAGDGATWFFSPEAFGSDLYIYRWTAGGTPTYSDGYATQLSVLADGSVLARTHLGESYLRIGSQAGLGSVWQLVNASLVSWRTVHGLPIDGSQDQANPSGDGIANLLKYAFNMAPNAGGLFVPNLAILPENGSAGLPNIARDAQGRLTITFVRRKAASNPGILYEVLTGDDLADLQPLDISGAVVESIDDTWERVTATDPATTDKNFGRLQVTTSL